jgi:hypothetical protein
VVGWLDDERLLVADYDNSGRRLVSVDIASGQARTLSTFEQAYDDGTQLAPDLLRSPAVDAKAPPHPVDPRRLALEVGGSLLLLLFLLNLVVVIRRARA